jgi:hypothetical protein
MTSNSLPDKTQEELEEILHLVGCQCHAQGWNDKLDGKDNFDLTEVERLEKLALEEVTHYINKYYVPKGDLEDPSVSTEVGGNQVDKRSEATDE